MSPIRGKSRSTYESVGIFFLCLGLIGFIAICWGYSRHIPGLQSGLESYAIINTLGGECAVRQARNYRVKYPLFSVPAALATILGPSPLGLFFAIPILVWACVTNP